MLVFRKPNRDPTHAKSQKLRLFRYSQTESHELDLNLSEIELQLWVSVRSVFILQVGFTGLFREQNDAFIKLIQNIILNKNTFY